MSDVELKLLVKSIDNLTNSILAHLETSAAVLREYKDTKSVTIDLTKLRYEDFIAPLVYQGLYEHGWDKEKLKQHLMNRYSIVSLLDLPRSMWLEFAEWALSVIKGKNPHKKNWPAAIIAIDDKITRSKG